MKRYVTVGDLKDQLEMPYPRPVLWCEHCNATYSAHAGDYWNAPRDHRFECCGRPMKLVVERTTMEPV